MNRCLLLMFLLTTSFFSFSQTPVTVCDQTIKIGGTGEENLYYGFAEGDQIILEFESDKELKEIQVFELVEQNSSQKYSNFKATSAQTTIYVPQKAVYQFRFKNGAVAGRICKIKIQRIPESEATQRFNTGWKFKTLYDTTYVPYTEDSLVGYKTIYYQEIVRELINEYYDNRKISDETPIIHSKTSSEGQYKLVPINMPINTNTGYKVEEVIDCYIILGLGDDAIKKLASAAAEVSTAIASIPGPQQAATAAAAATTKAISAVYSTTDDEIVYTIYKNYLGQRSIIKPSMGFSRAAEWHFPKEYLQGSYTIQFFNDNIFDALKIIYQCYAIVHVQEYTDVTYDRERLEPQYVTLNKKRMVVNTTQIRVNAQ